MLESMHVELSDVHDWTISRSLCMMMMMMMRVQMALTKFQKHTRAMSYRFFGRHRSEGRDRERGWCLVRPHAACLAKLDPRDERCGPRHALSSIAKLIRGPSKMQGPMLIKHTDIDTADLLQLEVGIATCA